MTLINRKIYKIHKSWRKTGRIFIEPAKIISEVPSIITRTVLFNKSIDLYMNTLLPIWEIPKMTPSPPVFLLLLVSVLAGVRTMRRYKLSSASEKCVSGARTSGNFRILGNQRSSQPRRWTRAVQQPWQRSGNGRPFNRTAPPPPQDQFHLVLYQLETYRVTDEQVVKIHVGKVYTFLVGTAKTVQRKYHRLAVLL